jgi:hypothetical protein
MSVASLACIPISSAVGRLTLDDQVRAKDTHGRDTNTSLGGTVGSTKAGEDNGGGAAHGTEEGLQIRELLFIVDRRRHCDGVAEIAQPNRGRYKDWGAGGRRRIMTYFGVGVGMGGRAQDLRRRRGYTQVKSVF